MNLFNFFCFSKSCFWKNKLAITVQLLVQSPRKFLCVIWNLGTKTSKIHNVTFVVQNYQKNFRNVKKIGKIQMHSKKSINSFEMKKVHLNIYGKVFFCDLLTTFWHYYYAKYWVGNKVISFFFMIFKRKKANSFVANSINVFDFFEGGYPVWRLFFVFFTNN